MVQKATALGVVRVIPVATKLADIRLREGADAAKRVVRWQRIALEACKQSGRALVPEINLPIPFTDLVQATEVPGELKLMFSERGGQSLWEMKNNLGSSRERVSALVGSEGGWTDEEISLARDNKWHVLTLGGRTLRAETAAIAAAVLLQHLYGDLR